MLGLALIVYSTVAFTSHSPFQSLVVPCCGAALLIYGNAGTTNLIGAAMASPPMRLMGRISYSLYLWHWPFSGIRSLVRFAALARAASIPGAHDRCVSRCRVIVSVH